MNINPIDKLERFTMLFHVVTLGKAVNMTDAWRAWGHCYLLRIGLKKMSYAWFRNLALEAIKEGLIAQVVNIPGRRIKYQVIDKRFFERD